MSQTAPSPRQMLTTNWSMVRRAGGDTRQPECRAALEALCRAYWYPLYVYLRRRGHASDEAEDLVQSFFAALLEKDYLHDADQRRGRFRAFLLTALKHHAANEADRRRRQKRGGGRYPISLDMSSAAQRWAIEPADAETPDAAFERAWALELLRRVLDALAEEYAGEGKAEWFAHFRCYLVASDDRPRYDALARELGMTTTAVKVNVHRLRQRYRQRLEAEIAATVDCPEEIGQEQQLLLDALAPDRRA